MYISPISNSKITYGIVKNDRMGYISEEVNLSVCMDAIKERTQNTQEYLDSINAVIDTISRNYRDFHGYADQIHEAINKSDNKI